jgi:hypothetical protein
MESPGPTEMFPLKIKDDEDSEDDDVQPVVQMPSSNYSNLHVHSSSNIHIGNSLVCNGALTVLLSPDNNNFSALNTVFGESAKPPEPLSSGDGDKGE